MLLTKTKLHYDLCCVAGNCKNEIRIKILLVIMVYTSLFKASTSMK